MEKTSGSKTARLLLQTSLLLMLGFLLSWTVAAQTPSDQSSVRIPWDEFRKLLELDRDEFVLSYADFQILLRQTGFKYVPPFQLNDEKVVLTREQFKRLLSQMKPPEDPTVQPPGDYVITKANYQGTIVAGSARFKASYVVEIFEGTRERFVKIPFFPVNVALKSILFDGKPALVVLEGNRHTLTTDKTGRHLIEVEYSLKAATQQGPMSVNFPIPLTAVTILDLNIPSKDIDVEIPNAQELRLTEQGSQTHVYALLSPSNSMSIRWRKKPQEIEKGPAKIYADVLNLLSIDDDAMRIKADVSLSILHNTIPSILLRVPDEYTILDVQGNGIEDWREIEVKNVPYLEIQFDYPKTGRLSFSISAEKLLPDPSMVVEFSGFGVQEAVRQKGFLGIELKSASEVSLSGLEGLDKLDVSELPASLINRSQKPLLFGFKYLHFPFSLALDIQKHKAVPVLGTVIDSASGVTLFTEDGKLVHRIVYTVRNTSKQFMELELPDDVQIWSVFVGGDPAKPRLNNNRILIPLNRSAQGAAGLEPFEVELIYFERTERFSRWGRKQSKYPVPDIVMSQMLWSVYLPEGFRFFHVGGSVEKEKAAQGLRPFLRRKDKPLISYASDPNSPVEGDEMKERVRREAGKAVGQFSANLALSEEQLVEQIENEARFSQRVEDIQSGRAPSGTGILPIRINIPATGQLFRFAKTIVSGEILDMNCSYVSDRAVNSAGWTGLALILILAFFMRRRLAGLFKSTLGKFRKA